MRSTTQESSISWKESGCSVRPLQKAQNKGCGQHRSPHEGFWPWSQVCTRPQQPRIPPCTQKELERFSPIAWFRQEDSGKLWHLSTPFLPPEVSSWLTPGVQAGFLDEPPLGAHASVWGPCVPRSILWPHCQLQDCLQNTGQADRHPNAFWVLGCGIDHQPASIAATPSSHCDRNRYGT